jgi:hypothetical protein
VCAFNGGDRVLVTWAVGAGASATYGDGPAPEPHLVGTYRQLFTDTGRRAGRDTHLSRSIPGSYFIPGRYQPAWDCRGLGHFDVVRPQREPVRTHPTGMNTVQAFAYDPTGTLRQQAVLRRHHLNVIRDEPINDVAQTDWSGPTSLLLATHVTTSDLSPATLSVLALR